MPNHKQRGRSTTNIAVLLCVASLVVYVLLHLGELGLLLRWTRI